MWETAWLAWLMVFVGLEAMALFNDKKGDTLSEQVYRWFAVKDDRPDWWSWVRRASLGGAMIWLTIHWLTGGAV